MPARRPTTKAEAIGELVTLLADNGELTDPKKVLDAVLEREATRTTGIGNGLAIPHGKCTGTDHLVMAIGRPGTPIDFQAIDGRPVNLIWLLASPPDKTGPHIHALARISRLMTIDKFRHALAESQDGPGDLRRDREAGGPALSSGAAWAAGLRCPCPSAFELKRKSHRGTEAQSSPRRRSVVP